MNESTTNTTTPARRIWVWAGRVISGLVALVFAMSAFMKLKGGPELAQGMAHLGLPDSLVMPLAILEISCVVIYLIPPTSVLGAILLTGYIGGAILSSSRSLSEFSSGWASTFAKIDFDRSFR
jgi:hypothetical protein